KSYLDTKTIEYIEFICAPEMDSWDYKREFKNNNFNISDIKDFKEPYNINVENLDPQMSINKHNIVDELKRREILLGGYNNRRDIQSYFYSEKNFDILKKNVEYL
ncbi:MAG: hypothetical protein ACOC2U_04155, partial [bacterium]